MYNPILRRAALFSAAFATCTGCGGGSYSGSAGPAGSAGPFATITDLGNITTAGAQLEINDSGLMAGDRVQGSGSSSVADTWQVGGTPTALPNPNQGAFVRASALSSNGIVIGSAGSGGCEATPVVWQSSSFNTIQQAPSPVFGAPRAVNDQGQMVGVGNEPCGSGVAFGAQFMGLYWPTPTSAPQTFTPAGFLPLSINDSGLAVGVVATSNGTSVSMEYFKATPASSTTAVDLGLSGPDPSGAQAGNIVVNDAGTIALSTGANYALILISSSGAQTQVGTEAVPNAISSTGDVVGVTPQFRAFIYAPATGLVDMNKYVRPGAGFTLTSALSVNAHGQVLAFGAASDGTTHSLLVQLPSGTF